MAITFILHYFTKLGIPFEPIT